MKVSKEELITILAQFNPWWRGEPVSDLPEWKRAAFRELDSWMTTPPAPRAVLLSGARQIGKTTLILQTVDALLKSGVPAANILYATFDHPLLKLAGIDAVIDAWRAREPKVDGPEYLFLDEAQFIRDWGTWIKHQVDFRKERRIAFTGIGHAAGGRRSGIRRGALAYHSSDHVVFLRIPANQKIVVADAAACADVARVIQLATSRFLPHWRNGKRLCRAFS